MANVLFNTYCERACPYCFAKDKVELNWARGDSTKNMNLEWLEEVIDFYNRSQLVRFAVLGGEPTLHPHFHRMIDRILKERNFSLVLIFSNGLMPESALDYLSTNTDTRIKITLNLNSPGDYTHAQWFQINQTMAVLKAKVSIGINIYRSGQDYHYVIDAIRQYGLTPHVRVAITHPILGGKNLYAREDDFPAIADDLVSFVRKTYQHGIGFSFDCGFRFCMFTLEQHKELIKYAVKFQSVCSPVIDIGPNLRVWHCFPLSNKVNRHLTDFRTKNEMIHFYSEIFKNFYTMGNTPDCPHCRYRINGLCDGGCLARTIDSFQKHT